MRQGSKRGITDQLIRPARPIVFFKSLPAFCGVFLGITFSLVLISSLIPTTYAAVDNDETVTIYIENSDSCQNDSCLSEEGLVIKQGSTVSWQNNDNTFHTILSGFEDSGRDGKFSSDMITPGEEFSVTFHADGYYYYYCDAHPWMKGAILVV